MKNIRNLTLLMAAGAAFFFTACEKEDATGLETQDQAITQDVLDKLAGFALNTNDVRIGDFVFPDGTTEERYFVEDDLTFTREAIENLDLAGGITTEQYRTFNLVSSPRTIRVIGYTGGGGFGLSSRNRTGLQWAINNYNALNLGLTFQLDFGTAYQSYDIVVYRNPNNGGTGGSAGFPSGGNPNKFVQVYGLDNLSNNVNEHVIGHEIGHSVGLRHTDYFSRQSCGQNVNEGSAGVGAVHIPGTPTGYDSTSLMLACFSTSTNGEFNSNDRTALNYLY